MLMMLALGGWFADMPSPNAHDAALRGWLAEMASP